MRGIWKVLSIVSKLHNALIKCYQIIRTFLETRIQRLLDGLILVEKGLCIHVQRITSHQDSVQSHIMDLKNFKITAMDEWNSFYSIMPPYKFLFNLTYGSGFELLRISKSLACRVAILHIGT